MVLLPLVLLGFIYGTVKCDYACVQGSQTVVFAKDNTTEIGKADIGYCYPIVQFNAGDNIVIVAYKHQVGYIRKDSNVRIETCAADFYDGDALTTPLIELSLSTLKTTETTTTAKAVLEISSTTLKATSNNETTKTTLPIPILTASYAVLYTKGVCPQSVHEHASDGNNTIAIRGNTCYEVVAHPARDWFRAEKDCQARGGHLIAITSDDEQQFINELLSNNSFRFGVWIGLNDNHVEERFDWSSGNNVTYMNWLPGRKSSLFHGSEDCVYMSHLNNWQWDDSPCVGFLESDRHFVCQYRTVDPSTVVATTPQPSQYGNTKLCPLNNINHAKQNHGFLAQNGNSCYELLPNNKYTWLHGESICQSHGGHLAHISSAAEQAFIQSFMTRHSPIHAVWIGLHDTANEGHFEWTSGNPLTYLNWLPGHSDHFVNHNVEDCVAFIPYEGGRWDYIPCGSTGSFRGDVGEKHPLLCQYNTVKDAIIG